MMRTRILGILTLAFVMGLVASAYAQSDPPGGGTSSGDQTPRPGRPVVTAVVVASWSSPEYLVWEHLNQNWSLYGSTEIWIDYTSLMSVPSFTLEDLEAVGADVVIVSDPSGDPRQWTQSEADALEAYARQGHNLIGTYLLLQWPYSETDNRLLAPLWGLRSDLSYLATIPAAPSLSILEPGHCLFTSLGDPLPVGGYPNVQLPEDGTWDPSDLAGASFVAQSADLTTIVTAWEGPGYNAYYIDYMPEYQTGEHFESTQLLYNAIVCSTPPSPVLESTWGALKSLYR